MTWSWSVFIFFTYWVSCCSYLVLIFLLKLQYFSKFCSSVVEITPHLVDKLSFDIYLLITVHLCFLNLDKTFFVLRLALIIPILFLFSSKSNCSFKIGFMKKRVYCLFSVISHKYLFFSNSILWPIFTRLFRIISTYIESKN